MEFKTEKASNSTHTASFNTMAISKTDFLTVKVSL